MRLVFDIETNGFLADLDRLHCLVIHDLDDEEMTSWTPGDIETGVRILMKADEVIGHNIVMFDLPAIKKVYPWFSLKEGCKVTDTIILSRLVYADIKQGDFRLVKRGKLPGNYVGQHRLEAWGQRLGILKGEYNGPWDAWSQTMQDYCEQDVRVTTTLYRKLMAKIKGTPWETAEAIDLEHKVAHIVGRQEQRGFAFNVAGAQKLHATLVGHKLQLEEKLQEAFPPLPYEWVPKSSNSKLGYVKGQPITRYTVFKPSSRKQVAERLQSKYGWEPVEFTPSGEPKIDEDTLVDLPWPEAQLLNEYFMVEKRLGAVSEGKQAWLRQERNGRIHGSVNTLGAVTGRMTHSNPNLAQVPACDKPYGKESRSLFGASPGYDLVGCDADALELRCLAHFLARYDGGEYIRTVLEGKKDEGTDMHSVNARAIGLDPKASYKVGANEVSGRDIAKTFFYAFIYGAGDMKLGFILGELDIRRAQKRGKAARTRLMRGLPALGKLVEAVGKAVDTRGYLVGIDGRLLHVRSGHAALNTLLQSAGAVAMKKALVILDDSLTFEAGLASGIDYEFVANVHDEWQIEARPDAKDAILRLAPEAIRLAGEHFKFRCPLAGNASVGQTWADTH